MNEQRFQEILQDVLDNYGDDPIFNDVSTFDENGVLTTNKGLVVELLDDDGNRFEFQLTIVQSK